jgi:hypothetical protein
MRRYESCFFLSDRAHVGSALDVHVGGEMLGFQVGYPPCLGLSLSPKSLQFVQDGLGRGNPFGLGLSLYS